MVSGRHLFPAIVSRGVVYVYTHTMFFFSGAGGATATAKAGVPNQIFKKHGRWKSKNAKDSYIENPLDKCLSVSQQLGL